MNLSDKAYAQLKYLALVVIPGLATLIAAIGGIFDISYAGQVVSTLVAIDAFLGLLLNASSKKYFDSEGNFDGDLYISAGPDGQPELHAAWNQDPSAFKDKDVVTLRTKPVDQ